MQTLFLSKSFIDSLQKDPKVIKTMKIYGYDTANNFLDAIKMKLNENYDFINIDEILPFDSDDHEIYHMYNGYISGDLGEYKEITVSFSTMKDGKQGNVFITQQVVPMITSKLQLNKDFLKDNSIKKIFLLTSHLSKKMHRSENRIKSIDSTGSMVIKLLNVLGFDVIDFFPISNSNVQSTYNSLEEFVDHSNFINRSKVNNTNHNHVDYKDDKVVVSFQSNEKIQGQTIKFILFKALAAIELSKGWYVDLSDLIFRTSQVNKSKPAENVLIVSDYNEYVSNTYVSNVDEESRKEQSIQVETIYKAPESRILGVEEYLLEPEYAYNSNGKRVFRTSREKKLASFEKHEFICSCHNENHSYFTSSSTNMNYVEGHHMIPMEYQIDYWREFGINLDCSVNIIPLCPNCHQKIHKAVKPERLEIIMEVYKKYQDSLRLLDESMDIEKFAALYNVYIY